MARPKKRMKDGRALVAVSAKTADILDGVEDLTAWSDEELLRGQRLDKNGRFTGVPPKVVPQAVHAERIRRTMSKAHEVLRESTIDAVVMLRDVVNDAEAPHSARIQAAQLIMDRTLPKTDNVNLNLGVKEDAPWLKALKGGIVATGVEDDDIEDAEVIWDSDDVIPDHLIDRER